MYFGVIFEADLLSHLEQWGSLIVAGFRAGK
jgi:hypothetical protein